MRALSPIGRFTPSCTTRLRTRAGLTLLETLLALVIVGVGVIAFVEAQSSFARSNAWSTQSATGMLLANEIREMTRRLSRHDAVTGLSLNAGAAVGWGREVGEVDVLDIDDIDDLNGLTFGEGGTFPGPINALGEVVPQVNARGEVQLDNGDPVPLMGWRQVVSVTKVDPYNFTIDRNPNYVQASTASLPAIPVDEFPLRVTVVVTFQGVDDVVPEEVVRTTWVVPR
jgi:hypothetical protein